MSSPSPRDVAQVHVRWWPLVPIVLIGSGLLYAVQVEGFSFIRASNEFTFIIGLINVFVYVWVRAWSGLHLRSQVTTIMFLFAVQALLLAMFRCDEFSGDGRVLFRWRWTQTAEQRLAEYSAKADKRAVLANFTEIGEADSPSFRGANREGQYHVPELSLTWHEQAPRELWRHPVGPGWSSFAVVGEFCVTQEQRGSSEAVVCYELRTGQEVWTHLDKGRFDEATSGPGPRATPAIHAGHVYSFGANGILNCLNGTDGRVIWSHDASRGPVPLFGYSSSPLIHGNRVFITPGGEAGSIVALDINSGRVIWSQDSRKPGYSSPCLFRAMGEEQILVFDATGLHGYGAETGNRRWAFPWGDNSDDQVNVCQPLILSARDHSATDAADPSQIFISSGYGRGSAIVAVGRTASGEWTANATWRAKTLKSKFSNVVIHEKHAYGLDEGVLTCISLADGTRRWKNGRYGYGQLILVNETLLIQTEFGRIVLVETDPEKFTEVASLDVLHERTWNQPVVAGHTLLVRSDREAVCFELPRLTQTEF